jgi:hypothetical protein
MQPFACAPQQSEDAPFYRAVGAKKAIEVKMCEALIEVAQRAVELVPRCKLDVPPVGLGAGFAEACENLGDSRSPCFAPQAIAIAEQCAQQALSLPVFAARLFSGAHLLFAPLEASPGIESQALEQSIDRENGQRHTIEDDVPCLQQMDQVDDSLAIGGKHSFGCCHTFAAAKSLDLALVGIENESGA